MEVAVLAVAICFSLGATDSRLALKQPEPQLMCQCGCAQLLGECDHVGCPNRGQELDELNAGIAAGMSDQDIFDVVCR